MTVHVRGVIHRFLHTTPGALPFRSGTRSKCRGNHAVPFRGESGPNVMREEAGPIVHRAVRSGSVILILGGLEFIAGMILAQTQYAGYSLTQNYISDLGGANSPWWAVFDASVILLGVAAIFGALLVWSAFEERPSRGIGLGFLVIAGIGAIGVGVFPETTPVLGGQMHTIVSLIAFLGGGLGILILSYAMVDHPRWRVARPFARACGLVTLVALVLFTIGGYVGSVFYLGIGPGGMERLIVAPILLWAIVEGAHLYRLPRYAPSLVPKTPA